MFCIGFRGCLFLRFEVFVFLGGSVVSLETVVLVDRL